MTKSEQSQIARATAQGRGALLATLACIHRAGSRKTQKEVEAIIDEANVRSEFDTINGCLVYRHGD